MDADVEFNCKASAMKYHLVLFVYPPIFPVLETSSIHSFRHNNHLVSLGVVAGFISQKETGAKAEIERDRQPFFLSHVVVSPSPTTALDVDDARSRRLHFPAKTSFSTPKELFERAGGSFIVRDRRAK